MADRKYIVGGRIHKATGTRKIIVAGKLLKESIAAAAPTGSLPPMRRHSYSQMNTLLAR